MGRVKQTMLTQGVALCKHSYPDFHKGFKYFKPLKPFSFFKMHRSTFEEQEDPTTGRTVTQFISQDTFYQVHDSKGKSIRFEGDAFHACFIIMKEKYQKPNESVFVGDLYNPITNAKEAVKVGDITINEES